MGELRRVPSSLFRLSYSQITEPVAVTIHGRVFAYYVPAGTDERFESTMTLASPPSRQALTQQAMTQADRDRVLRRVAGKSK